MTGFNTGSIGPIPARQKYPAEVSESRTIGSTNLEARRSSRKAKAIERRDIRVRSFASQALCSTTSNAIMTPCTTIRSGRYADLNNEGLEALSELGRTGVLPSGLTATTAFLLLAHAEHYGPQYANLRLREQAFEALIQAFENRQDSITDYCRAIWLLAQSYDLDFLPGKRKALCRIANPFEDSVAPWIKFHEWEKFALLETLSKRSHAEDPTGLGPIRFSDLVPHLADLWGRGAILRIILSDNPSVTLRVTRLRDIPYVISNVAPYLHEGSFVPLYVKDFNGDFSFKVSKIECEKSKLDKIGPKSEAVKKLNEAFDKIRRENPSITFGDSVNDYPERVHNKEPKVAHMPWSLGYLRSYFPNRQASIEGN